MRFFLLVAAGAVALAVAGCGSSTTSSAGSGSTGIALSAKEFAFDPGTIQIDQPGTYTFTLSNDGGVGHALEVEGQGVEEKTAVVSPGSSTQLTVTFSKTGSYEFYCPVDGHRAKGMEGTLAVGAAAAGTNTGGSGGGTDTGKSGGYGYG